MKYSNYIIPLVFMIYTTFACQGQITKNKTTDTRVSSSDSLLEPEGLIIPTLKMNMSFFESYLESYSDNYSEISKWWPQGYTPYIMVDVTLTKKDTIVNFITKGCSRQGILEYLETIKCIDGAVLAGGFVFRNILFLLTTPSGEKLHYLFQPGQDVIHIPIPNSSGDNFILNTPPVVFLEIMDVTEDILE